MSCKPTDFVDLKNIEISISLGFVEKKKYSQSTFYFRKSTHIHHSLILAMRFLFFCNESSMKLSFFLKYIFRNKTKS